MKKMFNFLQNYSNSDIIIWKRTLDYEYCEL
jgi:hypothetical protein